MPVSEREFKDIRKGGGEGAPAQLSSDAFVLSLEDLVKETMTVDNRIWPAVAEGRLSEEYLTRLCKEYYFLGRWFTAEFGTLVSNAPDVDSLFMETSEHMAHWAQNLADEVGFLGDPHHVGMKIEWAHQLGISADELDQFIPMPETIGLVFTSLYYMRRSYEEGLAAFGWAGEKYAASTGYAKMLYEGMREHYGMDVENFRIHAYAEEDHGDKAEYLLKDVATTAGAQRRIRRAILHIMTLRNARTKALNAWLDEPGALRESA